VSKITDGNVNSMDTEDYLKQINWQ